MKEKIKNGLAFVGGFVVGCLTLVGVSAAACVFCKDGYVDQFGYDCILKPKEDENE